VLSGDLSGPMPTLSGGGRSGHRTLMGVQFVADLPEASCNVNEDVVSNTGLWGRPWQGPCPRGPVELL
jgi:hypothetical protein